MVIFVHVNILLKAVYANALKENPIERGGIGRSFSFCKVSLVFKKGVNFVYYSALS
jgi:hypothetical protein